MNLKANSWYNLNEARYKESQKLLGQQSDTLWSYV